MKELTKKEFIEKDLFDLYITEDALDDEIIEVRSEINRRQEEYKKLTGKKYKLE